MALHSCRRPTVDEFARESWRAGFLCSHRGLSSLMALATHSDGQGQRKGDVRNMTPNGRRSAYSRRVHAMPPIRMNTLSAALVLVGGLAAASAAQAQTILLEAEGGGHFGEPLSDANTRITSPFQIKDDATASLGR